MVVTITQYVLTARNLKKTFLGGREVLKDVSLSFIEGAKIGILGCNGAGKSTFLKILAGEDREYLGDVLLANKIQIGYLPQEPTLDPDLNVADNIALGLGNIQETIQQFNEISAQFATCSSDEEMATLIEKQTHLQEKIDAADAWDLSRRIEVAMHALQCPPGDSAVQHLSGGEKRRVALCKLLIAKPDLLLLDEPTNHLDSSSIAWLQEHLKAFTGTVIMITHDRYFLDHVTGWILEIDRGHAIPYQGNYSDWLIQKEKRLELETRNQEARIRSLKQEREWINASPKARQAKSKARIAAYEELLNQVTDVPLGENQIFIPTPPRLGNLVIQAENLSKQYGEKVLFHNLTFEVPPGGIVGIIGHNGAGKTSLFRLITGEEKPNSGSIKIGETVKLGYVNQSRDILNPKLTVWEAISDGLDLLDLGGRQISSRAYVASFNFKGPDQQKVLSSLSGGERNRIHLARILKSESNVLLLDEPTNDLDLDTLRSLEDALLSFVGSAMIISHDRWFLDRIVTHILAYEDDGSVFFFEGNYQEYAKDLKKRTGTNSESGSKQKYRKMN